MTVFHYICWMCKSRPTHHASSLRVIIHNWFLSPQWIKITHCRCKSVESGSNLQHYCHPVGSWWGILVLVKVFYYHLTTPSWQQMELNHFPIVMVIILFFSGFDVRCFLSPWSFHGPHSGFHWIAKLCSQSKGMCNITASSCSLFHSLITLWMYNI